MPSASEYIAQIKALPLLLVGRSTGMVRAAVECYLFYVMSIFMYILQTADRALVFSEGVGQKYEIVRGFFKHQMYNNIN